MTGPRASRPPVHCSYYGVSRRTGASARRTAHTRAPHIHTGHCPGEGYTPCLRIHWTSRMESPWKEKDWTKVQISIRPTSSTLFQNTESEIPPALQNGDSISIVVPGAGHDRGELQDEAQHPAARPLPLRHRIHPQVVLGRRRSRARDSIQRCREIRRLNPK